jgi:hypothetical protein
MKYTDALRTAVDYICEDAHETFYDLAHWADHTFNVVILVALTFGNFLAMPITAPLWALDIMKDPEGAEEEQRNKNDVE